MAISFTHHKVEPASLNLTPLIDVIFQLLIFFMLSSTFIYPSIGLDLPKGEVKEGVQNDQHLVLSMNKDSQLFLNQELVSIENLAGVLKVELEKAKDKSVYFRADKQLAYDQFFQVMQISTKSGAAHFNLIHEPEN